MRTRGAHGVVAGTAALGRWYRRALLDEGRRLVVEHRCLPAVRVLQRAVALAPGDARAHYYLGVAYVGIGRFASSLRHLQEAMRLAADDARVQERLAAASAHVRPEITDEKTFGSAPGTKGRAE